MVHADSRLSFCTPAQLLLALVLLITTGRSEPVISEFMASNEVTLADEDGTFSDWIEIHNPDLSPVDLSGWYLTDSTKNKTKWRFPSVTIPGGGFLVVFASNKNRTNPNAPLHTNFALSADGEYLGLIKPDGVVVAHEFAPEYPSQDDDAAYGLPLASGDPRQPAFLASATPGIPNSTKGIGSLSDTVSFSQPAGPFRNPFMLSLSGATEGHVIRYILGHDNGMATLTAASPVYSGPIQIENSTVITAAVFAADGGARGPVTSTYYAKFSPSIAGFSTQLPVLVLDSLGSGPLVQDDVDHPSWLYVYEPRDNGAPVFSVAPELISPLTATVRGSSSALFPKKGYNIKFTDEAGDERPEGLLDLPAYEKWALVAPWSFDFNYINNAFVYALSNQLGRWAPRTRLAEVFFNAHGNEIDSSDYAGIYVITERVEIAEGRLDLAELEPGDTAGDALTGAYLLKIDPPDGDEISWATERGIPNDGISSIVLVSPKAEDAAPAQVDYIRNYIQRMENALHADRASGWSRRTHLDYVDRASWVDHHLLNTFVCNPDAFIRSAYFHKDRGGKLAAGPVWDFDRAIASYWDERSFRWDVWSGVGAPDYWRIGWWGIIAEDPEFIQEWIDRWQSLRRTELSAANLRALVDTLSRDVSEQAVQRDAQRWPDNLNPLGNYATQITFMRNWLVQRASWIDEQFLAPPTMASSGDTLTFTAPANAQLVYTLDGSDPRSLGGDIAPNAVVATGPLTVSSSANVHVRSYRVELRGTFPDSPWSSAVGGEHSSPLTPKARLVNLSSRAVVGTGENALIAGVVVADTEGKRYLSRAIGPGLGAFGASNIIKDPQLSVFAGNGTEIFRNNGWETGLDAAQIPVFSREVGAFPLAPGSKDSALATDIAAGSYTLQITTPTGQGGVGLAEFYELDANGRTVNLSTRAHVRTDEGVLIGGFVVSGPAYKRLLIRAVGPTLAAFGISDALADPVLTIYSGQEIVASNDRWESTENPTAFASASSKAGAFALAPGSEDAALLITLPPGAYTTEVKGKSGTEGVALLEIYELP